MSAPTITTTVNYTADNGRRPNKFFYEPTEPFESNPAGTDPRSVRVHNAWLEGDRFELDRHGFVLRPFDTGFDDFDDARALRERYYPQVADLVKKQAGAVRVEIFDHTIRKRMSTDLKQQSETTRPPSFLAHVDYTESSALQRVSDLFPAEAERLRSRRIAFFNVWKPLRNPVFELPLALCDATTHADEDFLEMDLKYRDRTGGIYVLRHSSEHKWFYFPQMQPTQALILKTYDSARDGRARFTGHAAIEDPNTRPGALPRESIEVRTMAFF